VTEDKDGVHTLVFWGLTTKKTPNQMLSARLAPPKAAGLAGARQVRGA